MKKIYLLILSLLLAVSCADDDNGATSEAPPYVPPAPSPGFNKTPLYRQPNRPTILGKSSTYLLPNQGKHWKDGKILIPNDGEVEISGRMTQTDVSSKYFAQNLEIEIRIGDVTHTITERITGTWEDVFTNVYADFKPERFTVTKGQTLGFHSSTNHEFLTYARDLTNIIIYFKPKKIASHQPI